MKILRIAKGVFSVIIVLTLNGCGVGHEEIGAVSNSNTTNKNGSTDSSTATGEDEETSGFDSSTKDNQADYSSADHLIDSATMIGNVTSFSNEGCSANQQISEDGGQTAKIAAEGNNDSNAKVDISYREDCVFQIAQINIKTGAMTLQDASKSDVKKSSSILIFGEINSTHSLVADKIIITRYE